MSGKPTDLPPLPPPPPLDPAEERLRARVALGEPTPEEIRKTVLAKARRVVMTAACRWGLSDADLDDFAQEVMVELLRGPLFLSGKSLDEVSRLVYGLTTWRLVDRKKRTDRHRESLPKDDLPDIADEFGLNEFEQYASRELNGLIKAAVSRVDDEGKHQTMLKRKLLDGDTYAEIAFDLGISEKQAREKLRYALRKLSEDGELRQAYDGVRR